VAEFFKRGHGHGGKDKSGGLLWAVIKLTNSSMSSNDLKMLLTNPEVFPIEISLTSGDKIKITHPDYVFFSPKMGQIFLYPQDGQGEFEWIEPQQIAKIRAKVKKKHAA
jgi:hypothetical protein